MVPAARGRGIPGPPPLQPHRSRKHQVRLPRCHPGERQLPPAMGGARGVTAAAACAGDIQPCSLFLQGGLRAWRCPRQTAALSARFFLDCRRMWSGPRSWPTRRTSSPPCQLATTRRSPTSCCQAGSGSVSRLHGRWCATRPCSSWTRRRRRWMQVRGGGVPGRRTGLPAGRPLSASCLPWLSGKKTGRQAGRQAGNFCGVRS